MDRTGVSRWAEGIFQKMLICMVWQLADDSVANESEGERKFRFDQDSDDLVII